MAIAIKHVERPGIEPEGATVSDGVLSGTTKPSKPNASSASKGKNQRAAYALT